MTQMGHSLLAPDAAPSSPAACCCGDDVVAAGAGSAAEAAVFEPAASQFVRRGLGAFAKQPCPGRQWVGAAASGVQQRARADAWLGRSSSHGACLPTARSIAVAVAAARAAGLCHSSAGIRPDVCGNRRSVSVWGPALRRPRSTAPLAAAGACGSGWCWGAASEVGFGHCFPEVNWQPAVWTRGATRMAHTHCQGQQQERRGSEARRHGGTRKNTKPEKNAAGCCRMCRSAKGRRSYTAWLQRRVREGIGDVRYSPILCGQPPCSWQSLLRRKALLLLRSSSHHQHSSPAQPCPPGQSARAPDKQAADLTDPVGAPDRV